jgi:hypothetical protein
MLVSFEDLTTEEVSSEQKREFRPGERLQFRNLTDTETSLDSLLNTIEDTISQLINMFKYPDRQVRQEAVLTFGRLAQHGEQLMLRKWKQLTYIVREAARQAKRRCSPAY